VGLGRIGTVTGGGGSRRNCRTLDFRNAVKVHTLP